VFGTGGALGVMHALHLDEARLDRFKVARGGARRGKGTRLGLEPAPHLERLQKRVALGDDRERQVHGGRADRTFQEGAAALAYLDDAEGEPMADDLTDGRPPDPQRFHELALARQLLARPEPRPLDEINERIENGALPAV